MKSPTDSDLRCLVANLSSRLSVLTGFLIEVHTAPKKDSLFICAVSRTKALAAINRLEEILGNEPVVVDYGPDDWGYYYRVKIWDKETSP